MRRSGLTRSATRNQRTPTKNPNRNNKPAQSNKCQAISRKQNKMIPSRLALLLAIWASLAAGMPSQQAARDLLQPAAKEPAGLAGPSQKLIENGALVEDYKLDAFAAYVVNATTAELVFMLPLFALTRPAEAEVAYTGLPLKQLDNSTTPDEPPAEAVWFTRPKIRPPEGSFSRPLMSYILTNLKPEHKYWLDLSIIFTNATEHPFNKPMLGETQTIVMPPMNPTIILRPKTQSAEPTSEPPPATELEEPTSTTTTSTTTTTTSTTTTTTTTPPPTTTTSTTTTTTSTAATTTTTTTPEAASKPAVTSDEPTGQNRMCADYEQNRLDGAGVSLPWVDVQLPLNAPIHKYAWHLLFALTVMSALFAIVSYLYLRKSGRVIAPISTKKPMDPTIAKLVSYYAILVDENNQNYANDAILAKQKTLELEQSSPPPFIMNR